MGTSRHTLHVQCDKGPISRGIPPFSPLSDLCRPPRRLHCPCASAPSRSFPKGAKDRVQRPPANFPVYRTGWLPSAYSPSRALPRRRPHRRPPSSSPILAWYRTGSRRASLRPLTRVSWKGSFVGFLRTRPFVSLLPAPPQIRVATARQRPRQTRGRLLAWLFASTFPLLACITRESRLEQGSRP